MQQLWQGAMKHFVSDWEPYQIQICNEPPAEVLGSREQKWKEMKAAEEMRGHHGSEGT